MKDIKSMTPDEITGVMQEYGEPAFRGKQVFTWLHRGVTSFDAMTNLSKGLREKLAKSFLITAPRVACKQVSRLDGTTKYLWELGDGNCIETVLMHYHHGNTVCISSQVGCRMCVLCVHSWWQGKRLNSIRDVGSGPFYPSEQRRGHLQYCPDGDR